MTENEISNKVIGIAIEVHNALGPGLLENTYKECLYYKLVQAGYKIEKLDCGYQIDLLVEDKLVLELKSVEELSDLHFAQTLTYLRLGNFKLGLLLNFNSVLLKEGIRRVVNKL